MVSHFLAKVTLIYCDETTQSANTIDVIVVLLEGLGVQNARRTHSQNGLAVLLALDGLALFVLVDGNCVQISNDLQRMGADWWTIL